MWNQCVWRYNQIFKTEKLLLKRVYSKLLDKIVIFLTDTLSQFDLGFFAFLTNELSIMCPICKKIKSSELCMYPPIKQPRMK